MQGCDRTPRLVVKTGGGRGLPSRLSFEFYPTTDVEPEAGSIAPSAVFRPRAPVEVQANLLAGNSVRMLGEPDRCLDERRAGHRFFLKPTARPTACSRTRSLPVAGEGITLLDGISIRRHASSIPLFGVQTETIAFACVLVGVHAGSDARFDRLEIEVPGLAHWLP